MPKKVMTLKFADQLTPDEIADGLGIIFDNATVKEIITGYKKTFNDMFHESNISVYPFKWK
jgi:hypothetical protein